MRPLGRRRRHSGWPSSFAAWHAAQCCAYTFAPRATLAVSRGSLRGSSAGAPASPHPPSTANASATALRTGSLNEPTDLGGPREHPRGAIALHAGADHHRLPGPRPEPARVGLEAPGGFPDLLALSVPGLDGIGVAAFIDPRGPAFGWPRAGSRCGRGSAR